MKKLLLLTCILTLPICGCSKNDKTVKIFISSNKEVDVNRLKDNFPDYKLEVSFANPSSYYYSFLYKSSREKLYDIFIIRDEEFLSSNIANIYVPFDEENLEYLSSKEHDFYKVEDVSYAIKLTSKEYKINGYIDFEEGHEYFISLAKMSKKVGKYSINSSSSYLAFECLNTLL